MDKINTFLFVGIIGIFLIGGIFFGVTFENDLNEEDNIKLYKGEIPLAPADYKTPGIDKSNFPLWEKEQKELYEKLNYSGVKEYNISIN